MPVRGFIVEGTNGSFLDHGFNWKDCKHQSETYVHHVEDIGDILIDMQTSEVKPMHLYPAQYDPDVAEEDRVTLLSASAIDVAFP